MDLATILSAGAAILAAIAVVLLMTQRRKDNAIDTTLRAEGLLGRQEAEARGKALREELAASQRGASDSLRQQVERLDQRVDGRLDRFEKDFAAAGLTLRATLDQQLDRLREENAKKLEEMRVTVDEKLQGTLEKRLGESFALVSQRLELVHKGLGEMQTLATGVGDLKRVLTNVKARGGWGEVQLGALLEQVLAPEQFDRNVRVNPASNDVVEFAVKLPGPGDAPVWLPLDAKFPVEDYERLMRAYDQADPAEVERAARDLETQLRKEAKRIAEKYIAPPSTTDFAIMFLPTEGLYAEAIRRPTLGNDLQAQHRVSIAGPTTLAALLNSLQMGFRTLTIERRSAEVWRVLSDAQNEFKKFVLVVEKVENQLDLAQRTLQNELGRRSRAIERSLRDVEGAALPDQRSPQ